MDDLPVSIPAKLAPHALQVHGDPGRLINAGRIAIYGISYRCMSVHTLAQMKGASAQHGEEWASP